MRGGRFAGGLAVLLAAAGPLPAQVESVDQLAFPPLRGFDVPQPERLVLANGLVLILLEDHELPLVDGVARIRTGSRWEPADEVGLAALTGEVLRTGGTTRRRGEEIDLFLEGKAASVETSISTTAGLAGLSCLTEDFPAVLELFAEILRKPAFEEGKLEVAKAKARAAVARQNDSPNQILFRELAEIAYGGDSPYARGATYDTLAAVERDDLVAWHRRWFHPNHVVLGLTGDFRREEVVALVERAFGDWPRGAEPASGEAAYRTTPTPGVFWARKRDVTQSGIAIGHLGIRRDHPDYFAVTVFNEVFSGGFASRLVSNVRSRKGLAYSVRGAVGSSWDYPGLFQMWMTTRTESTGAGIEALLGEVDGLTEAPITAEEVAKAKAAILNSFVFTSDTRLDVLDQQVTFEYYGYPLDWLSRYRRGIEAVTVEEVRRMAERHVRPPEFSILVVGPEEGRDKPLETFGPVTEVDITISPQTTAQPAGRPQPG